MSEESPGPFSPVRHTEQRVAFTWPVAREVESFLGRQEKEAGFREAVCTCLLREKPASAGSPHTGCRG